jgi:recombination protein RecA
VKNKIAPPFRETEFDIMFDSGISYEGDLLDLAIAADIVQKSGAWINYGSVRLGQGRENAKKYLIDYPEVCNEIRDKIVEAKGLIPVAKPPAEETTESQD